MHNQELSFLNKFVKIYEELIRHEGYGDIQISIRKTHTNKKRVSLFCGREYTFDIDNSQHRKLCYKIIDTSGFRNGYLGPERRQKQVRRKELNRRQLGGGPRNFRLERRLKTDRRSNYGRRFND